MELRHYDSNGNIDYDAIRAAAAVERREAIDAFWHGLAHVVATLEARLAARVRHAVAWPSPHVGTR